jgi:phospholipid/cholesterol/gamma-HCH transport system substrate-binding protein
MEADKRYFIEGLFIIVFSIAIAFAFVWLSKTGQRDDVLYRIHFTESVSGLALGDPVKFHGVDVGTVKAMKIDEKDPRRVEVDVGLRKETPVKTDTKATLKMKGITGVVMIELDGGSAEAKSLVEATPAGQVPEIPATQSALAKLLDELPKMVEKFTSFGGKAEKLIGDIGGKADKVLGDMGAAAKNAKDTSAEVKENPSLLLRRRPKEKDK